MVSKYSKVILHCAATPDYTEKDPNFDMFGLSQIHDWHVNDNGWSDVGYHYIVRRTGVIEKGRPLEQPGAHARGHNHDSVGVCYVGTNDPTPAQLKALLVIYDRLYHLYGIDYSNWLGHYEVNLRKSCPGFSMTLFREFLKASDERNLQA